MLSHFTEENSLLGLVTMLYCRGIGLCRRRRWKLRRPEANKARTNSVPREARDSVIKVLGVIYC